tara:strand:+ start:271748 stop:273037 length:1290 start_codon:yes stop_codon:yes gene_type:complete
MFASLCNTIDLEMGPKTGEEQIGLDFQVGLKLAIAMCCAMIGCWGLIQSPRVRRAFESLPGATLFALAIVLMVTASVAIDSVATQCRVAALVNFGYLLFVPTALSVLGWRTMAKSILCGLAVYVVAAWTIYLAIPEMGVFQEQLGDDTAIARMGGLGHPNAVARIGVLTVLLSVSLMRRNPIESNASRQRGSAIKSMGMYCLIALALGITAAAISRTAIAAGILALMFLLSDRLFTRAGITWVLSGMVLGIGVVLAALMFAGGGGAISDKLLSAGTKTGEIEEIASITGRTEIWAETIRLIRERPITGYGLNSAPILLEDYSQHAHNMLLHVTLSGGLFAGALVLALLLWTMALGICSSEPLIRAIAAFILLSGLVEDTALDTFASPATILWLMILLYRPLKAGLKLARSPIDSEGETPYNGELSRLPP